MSKVLKIGNARLTKVEPGEGSVHRDSLPTVHQAKVGMRVLTKRRAKTVFELCKCIRKKCLECSNYQPKEVRLCPITERALWPYRMGRNHGVHYLKPLHIERKSVA